VSAVKLLAGVVGGIMCAVGIAAGLGSYYMGQTDKWVSVLIGIVLIGIGAALFDWAVGYSRRKKRREAQEARMRTVLEAADRSRRTCPSCGQTLSVEQDVCPWCGHEMDPS
jgi:predicted MFS family arabinose efflux permease